jgi:hypothetical protein
MSIDRRSVFKHAAALSLAAAVPKFVQAASENPAEKADYTLRIGTGWLNCRHNMSYRPHSTTDSFQVHLYG